MPDTISFVGYPMTRRFKLAIAIKQAQLHRVGVGRSQAEIHAFRLQVGA
jgi:hypothetical protein